MDSFQKRPPMINGAKSASTFLLNMAARALLVEDIKSHVLVYEKDGKIFFKLIDCISCTVFRLENGARFNSKELQKKIGLGKAECKWDDIEEALEILKKDENISLGTGEGSASGDVQET